MSGILDRQVAEQVAALCREGEALHDSQDRWSRTLFGSGA